MKKPFKVNIKAADLPPYLSPKIISAVGYINQAAPNIQKSLERINTIKGYLTDQELKWVMALLVFDRLCDMAADSSAFKDFEKKVDERKRTIN